MQYATAAHRILCDMFHRGGALLLESSRMLKIQATELKEVRSAGLKMKLVNVTPGQEMGRRAVPGVDLPAPC